MENEPDAATQFPHTLAIPAAYLTTTEKDPPTRGLFQGDQELPEGGLAATALADQAEYLLSSYGQTYPVDGTHPALAPAEGVGGDLVAFA